MGKIFITPISEAQVHDKATNAQTTAELVSIRQSISEETQARGDADSNLTENLSALSDTVTTEINERKAAIESETALREAAVAQLQEAINDEVTARGTTEVNITSQINSAVDREKTERMQADGNLNTNLRALIGSETALREAAIDNVLDTIGSETAARTAADNIFDVAISTEAQSRANADSQLTTALDTEKRERIAADDMLRLEIQSIVDEGTSGQISAVNRLIEEEAQTRESEDTKLSNAIGAEKTARESDTASLKTLIQSAVTNARTSWQNADSALMSNVTATLATYAPLNSPNFTGNVKLPDVATNADSAIAVNKGYVDNKLSNIELNLNAFTAPTASQPGTQGQVPAPEKGLTLRFLTNFGWRTADDSTLTVSTLPMQSGTIIFNGENREPVWANLDPAKLALVEPAVASDAGVYVASVKPIDMYIWADTLDQRAKEITWEILPQPVTPPSQTRTSFEYKKSAWDFTLYTSGYDSTKMTRTGDTSGTSVGSAYQTVYTLNNPANKTNYVWSDDNSTRTVTHSWSIAKQKLSAAQSDGFAQITDLIYTGQVQTLLPSNISNFDEEVHVLGGTTSGSEVNTYHATIKPNELYTWSDGTEGAKDLPWNIVQSLLSEEYSSGFAQDGTVTYNGTAQTPVITHYNPAYHELGSDCTKTDAGTYTLTIKPRGVYKWADGTATPITVTWILSPKAIDVPKSTLSTFNYNGGSYSFVPTYAPDSDTVILISSDSVKNASGLGSYAVKYTLNNPSGKINYVWKDDGSTRTVTLSWKIVTSALSADLSSGFAQTAALTFNNTNQTVTISHVSSTLHTVTGNIASDAGTYTATITPVYGYMWNDGTASTSPCTETKTVIWTIAPIYSAKPTLSQNHWDYTGSSVNAANKLTGGYNTDLVEFSGTLSASEPGSYTITAKLKNPSGKTNYQWTGGGAADISLTWKIGAKLLTPPNIAGATTYNYSFESGKIVITGTEYDFSSGVTKSIVTEGYQSTYMESTGTLSASDAGTYEVTYTLKDTNVTLWNINALHTSDDEFSYPAGAESYAVVIRWKINPIKLSAAQSTFTVSGEYYYNQSEQTVTISGFNASYHEITNNKGTNASTYTARITPKKNYAFSDGSTSAKTVDWTIQPAQVRIDVTVDTSTWKVSPSATYNGNEYDFSSTSYFKYTVTKGKTAVTFSGTYKATNAGTGTGYANASNAVFVYGGATRSGSITIGWTIERARLNNSQSSVSGATYTYGDNPAAPIPNYNTSYHTGGVTSIANMNAGTHTYTIYPTSNYAWSDGTTTGRQVTITIDPKTVTKPSAIQSEFTYDSAVTVAFLNTYIRNYDSTTMTAGSTTEAKNAGDYTITFALKNTTNYKWNDNTTTQFSINWKINKKKVPVPTARQTSFVYTGSEINLVDYLNNYDSTKMDIASNTLTAVGSTTASITLKDSKNYSWSDSTTDAVTIGWQVTPQPLDKPYCKFADTTIQWTGSYINWLEYAIVGYDSATMTFSTSTSTIGATAGYAGGSSRAAIGSYVFGIKPKNNNYMWKGTDQNRDYVLFYWSIVRQRLSGTDDGYFKVTNGTANSDYCDFYYDRTTSTRPTAVIENYNPNVHKLFKTAEGGTATTSLALTWTVGEYTWGIEPKDNYAWSDGTYGRQTFKVRVVKAPLKVVWLSGGELNSRGAYQINITDADAYSSAVRGLRKTVTFKLVDHNDATVSDSVDSLGLRAEFYHDDTTYFEVSDISSAPTRTVYVYGKQNGEEDFGVFANESDNYQGLYGEYVCYVTVNRSLATLSWAQIQEIVQNREGVENYASGYDVKGVTYNNTTYQAVYLGDEFNARFCICRKSGIDGHFAFTDSKYGTLVTDGSTAFSHLNDSTDSETWSYSYKDSNLRVRCTNFYNGLGSSVKNYIKANSDGDYVYLTDFDAWYFSYNKAAFHNSTGAEVKVWDLEGAKVGFAFTFTGNGSTYEDVDPHMSLGFVPCFEIG